MIATLLRAILLAAALTSTVGCGGREDIRLDESGDGDGGGGGGGGGGPCSPGDTQCNNCEDDDDDGLTDGFDPECTGAADDDEGSFATGIPGDNADDRKQDCFYDGNSGGNCQVDTCCLYADGECPIDAPAADCAFDLECVDECIGLVPPGCDCFGCCTVCADGGCFDVLINPAVNPGCSQETVSDPVACPTCEKLAACAAEPCDADPDDCVLCPGEDAGDLPAGCNEVNECSAGVTPCPDGSGCAAGSYCQNGCCVDIVE